MPLRSTPSNNNAAVIEMCSAATRAVADSARVPQSTTDRREAWNRTLLVEETECGKAEASIRFTCEELTPQNVLEEHRLLVPSNSLYTTLEEGDYSEVVALWSRTEDLHSSLYEFRGVLENVALKLHRVTQELRRTQLRASRTSAASNALLDVLVAIAAIPLEADVLQHINEKVEHMEGQLTDIHEATKEKRFLREDEVEDAEKQLTLRSSLIDCMWEKFQELNNLEEVMNRYTNLQHLKDDYRRDTIDRVSRHLDLKQRSESDIDTLNDALRSLLEADMAARARYRTALAESDKLLLENKHKQGELWDSIQKLEFELQVVAERRIQETSRRLDIINSEMRRSAETIERQRAIRDYMNTLESTVLNSSVAVDHCSTLGEVVEELQAAAQLAALKRVEGLEACRLNIHKEYLKFFTLHCRLMPVLIDFNEQNLEHIYKSMTDSYKFSYLYRDRRTDNERDLKVLLLEQREEWERFKPVMDYLHAHGVEFSNSVLEVSLPSPQVSERRYNIQQYRRAFTKMGESDIDEAFEIANRERASNGIRLCENDVERPPELYFSVRSPLATPRQLQRMKSNRTSDDSPAYPFASGGASHSPPREPTSPRSPIDDRTAREREEDHPAIARRSVLATRPIVDKRPGSYVLRVHQDVVRKSMGLGN